MNYIGSKISLLGEIDDVLSRHCVPTSGIALDVFAGTGVVAHYLKRRGHCVYANDWQRYSYVTCVALLEFNEPPTYCRLPRECSSDIHSALDYLNQLPGTKGTFWDDYCQAGSAGRQYFSLQNGQRIQAIRDQIKSWRDQSCLSDQEEAYLIASLLEAADKVANTASVYGAYLKHIKRSADQPLKLKPFPTTALRARATEHRAFCEDSLVFSKRFFGEAVTLAYIDPPYNARQYSSNYHILETIARWDVDAFEARGVTGLRENGENASPFCSKRKANRAFQEMLSSIQADYVLFSYSNEGLLSRSDLDALFTEQFCWHAFLEIPYKRFRADSDSENRVYDTDETREYLILGSKNPRRTSGLLECPQPVGLHLSTSQR